MSYYYLTHGGFKAILPQLEAQYLTSIKKLNLAGNALTDISIAELCLSLKQLHV
jgi:Leucine-rich repeat (LRR) protein